MPGDLRALIWLLCEFTWQNDGQAVGFVPVKYLVESDISDSLVKLARKTECLEKSDDTYHGIGQRLFATDQHDYPILELREVMFESSESEFSTSDPQIAEAVTE